MKLPIVSQKKEQKKLQNNEKSLPFDQNGLVWCTSSTPRENKNQVKQNILFLWRFDVVKAFNHLLNQKLLSVISLIINANNQFFCRHMTVDSKLNFEQKAPDYSTAVHSLGRKICDEEKSSV
ncbi:hypothetical protein POM88_020889 [Heracleum sosnowskyi]|uniref:Uncharacterized protein n=1 Tax=Heracleum sosnowskyi TaxID=360622 RepID=A0AAD8ICD3_9APIA|nr:hypothetical protein POM88_020889 [Heracleum sosnowskyi]